MPQNHRYDLVVADLMMGHPSFPITRALFKVVNDSSPGSSNNVLFGWKRPGAVADWSIEAAPVRAEALDERGRMFRTVMPRESPYWGGLFSKPKFWSDTHLSFLGSTEGEIKCALTDGPWVIRIDRGRLRMWREAGQVHLELRDALRLDRTDLLAAQQRLLCGPRKTPVVIAEKELVISRSGWVLHGARLADFYGITRWSRESVKASCGSFIQHVIHAETCANEIDIDEEQSRRLSKLVSGVRRMNTEHTDEVLLSLLYLWHQTRDDWADGKLRVGSQVKHVGPQEGFFVRDSDLLDTLGDSSYKWPRQHSQAERYLLPLFVLSRMSVDSKTVDFPRPPLTASTDCVEPQSEDASYQWLKEISAAEKRGFVVAFSDKVRRRSLPTYRAKGGPRVWGKPAIEAARREVARRKREGEDEDEGLVDRLRDQWDATGPGYFSFPVIVSMAAMSFAWKASARRLARVLLSNLDSRPNRPRWAKEESPIEQIHGYWAREVSQDLGFPSGWYFPVLGDAPGPWFGDTLLAAAGYACTTKGRRDLVEDLQFLRDEMGLVCYSPGRGGGQAALNDLEELAGSVGWKNVKIEALLPVAFLDELEERLQEQDVPSQDVRASSWTPQKIQRALRKKRWTQEHLATELGRSKSMVSQLLGGTRRVSADMDERLTKALKGL